MKTEQEIEIVIRQLNQLPNPNFPYRYTASTYFKEALRWVLDEISIPPLVQDAIKEEERRAIKYNSKL